MLEDVYYKDGSVLTGIQFYQYGHLIRANVFGKKITKVPNSIDVLEFSVEMRVTAKNYQNFKIEGKHIGVKRYDTNYNVKRSDRDEIIVEFGTSNERSDVGQTTIPFFDASDIVQDFPLVLSGIGFAHYANNEYGGYIRPILKSVDMKLYI